MSYTKKVIIKWKKDSYLNCGINDRDGDHATALLELDEKVTTMIAEGKMSNTLPVSEDDKTLNSIRYLGNQNDAEEWITFNNAFASKYGFVMINSVIISE